MPLERDINIAANGPPLGGGCEPRTSIYDNVDITLQGHLPHSNILQNAIFHLKFWNFSVGIPCTKFHWLHACMDRGKVTMQRERGHQSTTTKRASNPRGCNLGRSRPLSLREENKREGVECVSAYFPSRTNLIWSLDSFFGFFDSLPSNMVDIV